MQVLNSQKTTIFDEDKKDDQQKIITHEEAVRLVEEFCATPDGVEVTAYPEEDVIFKGRKFYYIEAVFGDSPAGMFYVDSNNGDIYSANRELNEDSIPLNRNWDFILKQVKFIGTSNVECLQFFIAGCVEEWIHGMGFPR